MPLNDCSRGQGQRVPKVNIIIPAYQASEFIGEALDSVFAQTFRDFEVIVINDGSPDAPALEKALQPYRGRIVYIEQLNKGVSAARNTGISAAKGEFLAFLDSDEVWLPDFLEKQLARFDLEPGLDMLWCDALLFGEGDSVGLRHMQVNPSTRPVDAFALLARTAAPLTSSVVVRRSAVLQAGGFDERFRRAEDFDLFLRLALAGKRLDFQNLALVKRRLRGESLSGDAIAHDESAIEVCRKLLGLAAGNKPLERAVEQAIRELECGIAEYGARQQLLIRDYRGAAISFKRANRLKRDPRLSAAIWLLERAPAAVLTPLLGIRRLMVHLLLARRKRVAMAVY